MVTVLVAGVEADEAETIIRNKRPAMVIVAGKPFVGGSFLTLITALVVWFGIGYLLGARFRYRLALEVVC